LTPRGELLGARGGVFKKGGVDTTKLEQTDGKTVKKLPMRIAGRKKGKGPGLTKKTQRGEGLTTSRVHSY